MSAWRQAEATAGVLIYDNDLPTDFDSFGDGHRPWHGYLSFDSIHEVHPGSADVIERCHSRVDCVRGPKSPCNELIVVGVRAIHMGKDGRNDIRGKSWHEIYGSGSVPWETLCSMPIIPDTKNWTWVLERPCEECGFDASSFAATEVPGLIRQNAHLWPDVLARPDVRQRPNDSTWSPLEYAAHVRDVFRLFRYRLSLMMEQDDPLFPNWNQDETAVAERYNEQDPATVAAELAIAAQELAVAFEAVGPDQWRRPGRRSDGVNFTIESYAKYLIHDPRHHLHDVGVSSR
jgi:DinB superfamily